MNPYPAYRHSGVEWLGDVPMHWGMARVNDVFEARSGGTPSTAEDNYWEGEIPWVSAKDMKALRITDTEDHISEEAVGESATSLVPNGAVLLVTRSGILRHTLPVGLAECEVAINQDIKGLIPDPTSVDPLYFVYWAHGLQSALLTLWRQQGATVESLDFDSVRSTAFSLPPLDEQRAITAFLDRETERIDALVTKNRQLIERLQEYRAALITRTVTRGLPPDAARLGPSPRLKPSDAEWLSEVPENWEVIQPSFGFARIGSGTTPQSDSYEYYDGDTPWVTTSELRETTIFETAKSVTAKALRDHTTLSLYPAGALVIAMYGATIGRLGILGVPATVNQACCVFADPTRLQTRFVYYWLLGFRDVLISHSVGGGQPNLSQQDLRAMRIPAPDAREQVRIADFLDTQTRRLDKLVRPAVSAIERLHEYRTALITAAVTGKVDVRESVAAMAPDAARYHAGHGQEHLTADTDRHCR